MPGDLHGHYHGRIPFGIWVLLVAIGCIFVGLLIPGMGALIFIGSVLFILWLGFTIIALFQEFSS